MSLSVVGINQNSNIKKPQNNYSGKNVAMRGDSVGETKSDKANDGKFSTSQALKNFGYGLVSPVTSMFSSFKNFATGIGMLAGSVLLIAATGGAAAPLFVAGGVLIGAYQLGHAVHSLSKAATGDDVEKTFYEFGAATSTLGLSVMGAKSSLKRANVDTEAMGALASIKKTFTSAADFIQESVSVFKSGYYKTNIKNAWSFLHEPKTFKKFSKEMAKECSKDFDESFNALRSILPEEYHTQLSGRAKSQVSIWNKLKKERTAVIDNKIKNIEQSGKNPEKIKTLVDELNAERVRIKTDYNFAKGKIEDLYGARLTLDDISPAGIEKFITVLENAIKKGELEVQEIEGYFGHNPKFGTSGQLYMTREQMVRIRRISPNLMILREEGKISGYNAIQLKIKPKNSKLIELQIRGKEVDRIAEIEHFPYDLSHGKDIAKGNNEVGNILEPIKNAVLGLSKDLRTKYQKYFYDQYIHAQQKEFGISGAKPTLPEGVDPMLSIENIELIQQRIKGFKSRPIRNPLTLDAQMPLLAGAMQMQNDN